MIVRLVIRPMPSRPPRVGGNRLLGIGGRTSRLLPIRLVIIPRRPSFLKRLVSLPLVEPRRNVDIGADPREPIDVRIGGPRLLLLRGTTDRGGPIGSRDLSPRPRLLLRLSIRSRFAPPPPLLPTDEE